VQSILAPRHSANPDASLENLSADFDTSNERIFTPLNQAIERRSSKSQEFLISILQPLFADSEGDICDRELTDGLHLNRQDI
jgi:hypothetical protein